MNISFQSINYNADNKLIEFSEKRIKKISQFYFNIIDVFIYTKFENTSDRVNKFAELKIVIPGDEVVVKKQAKTFEKAINLASRVAERILKKRKNKQQLFN
tara:strand:- start:1291 stop:1593 length:303 start_codon:yes stop_codon:yes gene_type:complete